MRPQLANTDRTPTRQHFTPDEQGGQRSERLQPGALVGQGVEAHPRQRLAEDAGDVLEVDELEDVGGDRPARVLTEAEYLNRDAGRGDVLQRFAESLTVGGGDHDPGQPPSP